MSELDDIATRAELHANGLHEAADVGLRFQEATEQLRSTMTAHGDKLAKLADDLARDRSMTLDEAKARIDRMDPEAELRWARRFVHEMWQRLRPRSEP